MAAIEQRRVEPEFSADWSGARNYWPGMFADLRLAGKPGLRFLEIGSFEGMSTRWLVEQVLTHPSSQIVCVDTWEGSPEFGALSVDGDSFERFVRNLEPHVRSGKVRPYTGRSQDVLRSGVLTGPFDFVYVDGSHVAADVLADAVLAWPLLKPGAMMVFDDYDWGWDAPETEKPRLAVDAFVRCYGPQLDVRFVGYQYVVEKR